MDRLDYMNSQDAVVVQVEAAFAAYNQVKKTIPLMEKSLELQELTLQMTQKRQQLGQATQIDVLNAQKSLAVASIHIDTDESGASDPAPAALRPDRLDL